jgi:hypothetical protein
MPCINYLLVLIGQSLYLNHLGDLLWAEVFSHCSFVASGDKFEYKSGPTPSVQGAPRLAR